jgi:hypothetical protein
MGGQCVSVKQAMRMWIGFVWLRIATSGDVSSN